MYKLYSTRINAPIARNTIIVVVHTHTHTATLLFLACSGPLVLACLRARRALRVILVRHSLCDRDVLPLSAAACALLPLRWRMRCVRKRRKLSNHGWLGLYRESVVDASSATRFVYVICIINDVVDILRECTHNQRQRPTSRRRRRRPSEYKHTHLTCGGCRRVCQTSARERSRA